MIIVHKKKFYQGLVLLLSFGALVWIMMLPLFHDSEGRKLNSLQYADTIFNELSKGSSWFIPEVLASLKSAPSETVSLKIRMPDMGLARVAAQELEVAGVRGIVVDDGIVSFSGDLKSVLLAATEDSASLYNSNDEEIQRRYGNLAPLEVSRAWWHLLSPAIQELQKAGAVPSAKLVEMVVRRAIEPGNNFYGLPAAQVSENIALVCALLAFYVLYAIWYGFAIYHLFGGFALLGEAEAIENVEESEI